jgi:CBS domain containing-hemolysin-like protein
VATEHVLESPDTRVILIWILAAVGAAAAGSFFAAADRALVLLPEARLTVLVESAKRTPFHRYARDRQRILARWLVCRVVATSVAAVFLARAGDRAGLSHTVSLLVAMLASVGTYGTLAEILLSYARRRAESFGGFALRFLRPFEWVVMPLAEPLALIGRAITRSVTERRPVDARTTETQVELVVEEGERMGTLANEPAEMIRNVLEFKDLTAREVMVPRPRIMAIEIGTSVKDAFGIVTTEGHSRYPVYRESLDNVVGLLYAKDLFALVRDSRLETTKLDDLVRTPVLFVVETQPILSILREMRGKRLHMAIVSDEFGGTSGVVTLEDLIEEIVGDIRDEYDTDAEAQVQELGEGRLLADAAVAISDIAHKLGREIPTDGEFESIGGLLVAHSGRVPEVGASFDIDGLRLIVRDADERRVVKVEIVPKPDSTKAAENADDETDAATAS